VKESKQSPCNHASHAAIIIIIILLILLLILIVNRVPRTSAAFAVDIAINGAAVSLAVVPFVGLLVVVGAWLVLREAELE